MVGIFCWAVFFLNERRRCQLSSLAMFPDASGKFFQLEELEDKETATTEIVLNADRSVTFGKTDGPIALACAGTWKQVDGSFRMEVTRRFPGGKETKESTDMGEFAFDVIRTYLGDMTMVGASIAITGAMHTNDETLGDQEVGFFNMIDTTAEREGEE